MGVLRRPMGLLSVARWPELYPNSSQRHSQTMKGKKTPTGERRIKERKEKRGGGRGFQSNGCKNGS